MKLTDTEVAAWSRTQNHGVPPWDCLPEESRQWWRDRYAARHPAPIHITHVGGCNQWCDGDSHVLLADDHRARRAAEPPETTSRTRR